MTDDKRIIPPSDRALRRRSPGAFGLAGRRAGLDGRPARHRRVLTLDEVVSRLVGGEAPPLVEMDGEDAHEEGGVWLEQAGNATMIVQNHSKNYVWAADAFGRLSVNAPGLASGVGDHGGSRLVHAAHGRVWPRCRTSTRPTSGARTRRHRGGTAPRESSTRPGRPRRPWRGHRGGPHRRPAGPGLVRPDASSRRHRRARITPRPLSPISPIRKCRPQSAYCRTPRRIRRVRITLLAVELVWMAYREVGIAAHPCFRR